MVAKRPNSKRNLDMALRRVGGTDEDYVRRRTLVANAIVASLMPDGAVKGGSAMKVRFGEDATRASTEGHLPLHRRDAASRRGHPRSQPLDGADGRGGLRAADGGQGIRDATADSEARRGAGPHIQEPLRLLQTPEAAAQEAAGAGPRAAHAHATAGARGRA
ncbi:MAG: hypothetical protein IJF97_06045 [Eggerthellaceae bacterium]|nr:hypothetical protein [Eggerthellaceae bacterium]